jgi:hypothetical protein
MMLFAFGGKCGDFGASGLRIELAAVVRAPLLMNELSAIDPTPTPQRLKK